MDFPRVLVIDPVKFNRQTGGGVTTGNLFRGWPLDAIAQIHTDSLTEADTTVCTNYLHLPVSSIRRPLLRPRSIVSLARQVVDFAVGRQVTLGHWVRADSLLGWVQQFNPDVVYSRPNDHHPCYWLLPRQLSGILGIPYVVHVMDDWPARYESGPGLAKNLLGKPLLRRCLQLLFDDAAATIGISGEMCEAYGERYGRSFVPFHNCIDVSDWACIEKSYDTGPEFRLVYLGVVTEDKELHSLIDIREAVLSLRRRGYSVHLIVYSAPFYEPIVRERLEHALGVGYGGYVHPHDLPQALSRADVLVLPVNFDSRSQAYVRYSLQTKVPEYMASGTPVLVYGPSTSPNVRYAIRNEWGMVVDVPDKETLESAIIELMRDLELRMRLGQRAREVAFRNHDAEGVRHQFRQMMADAATGVYDPSSFAGKRRCE